MNRGYNFGAQDRAALLEDDRFLKNEDGVLFTCSEFHHLYHSTWAHSKITAPRMAFILFKLSQFLGADADNGPDDGGVDDEEGDDAGETPPLYKRWLQLCTANPGVHLGKLSIEAPEPDSVINLVVPPEARVVTDCACVNDSRLYLTIVH